MRTINVNSGKFIGKLYAQPGNDVVEITSYQKESDANVETFTINGRPHQIRFFVREDGHGGYHCWFAWKGIFDLKNCNAAMRFEKPLAVVLRPFAEPFLADKKFMLSGKIAQEKLILKNERESVKRDERNLAQKKQAIRRREASLELLTENYESL